MALFETWLKSDLKKPLKVEQLKGNLFSSDNGGNQIGVEVLDNGSPATLTGGVIGYVIRADGATVAVNGSLSGNRASIVLPASAYVVAGQVSIAIKVGTTTVGACSAYVYRTTTDSLVDPGHVIPSIEELLAKIADCEAATTAANTAATLANTKAGLADEKATLANTKASLADEKATLADQKATLANTAATAANAAAQKIDGMTVEASQLTPGSAPTAVVSEVSGHKHIAFGIPKGNTGTTPNITIGEVETLLPGEGVYVELDESSTPEEPVVNFGIPKGDPGSITNAFATNIAMSPTDSTKISEALSTKLPANQGSTNTGKFMRVGDAGAVSYDDPTERYASVSNFPATGDAGKLYIAEDTGMIYIWDTSDYSSVGGSEIPDFTGATSSTAGAHGLVPAPAVADRDKFLKGNGGWAEVPNPQVMTGATSSTAGTSGLVPAPAAGDQDKILMGDGTWSGEIPERLEAVENVCTDTTVTIAVSDWESVTGGYSYTWESNLVQSASEVEVFLRDGAEGAGIEEFDYEKVTGGVQFTTSVMPTGNLPVTIRVINAKADAFQSLTGEDIGTDVIPGADNVDEALNALNGKINVPDWSNPTNNICTVSNEGWTATGYGFIRVNAQWDRGGQLNINGITVYYVDKSYYGGINFHVEWLVPVKTGDIVKLVADNGTLPTSMSATFYPIR